MTDSFSVYTITAESGKNPIKVTIHHVDIETKKKIADVDNTVTTWYADTTENNYRSKLKDALLIYKKEDFETSSGAKYKYYGSSLDNAESEETKKVAEQWKTWCENYVKDNSDLANGTLELNLYYQDQTTKDVVFHPTFFDYYVDTKHGADASVYLTKGTTYTAKEWSGRGWTYPTKTIEKNGWYYENTEQASYWNGWTASYTYTLVADGYGSINSSSNYKNTGTHFEVGGKPDYGNYGNYEVNEHTSDNPIVSGIITGLSGTENETVEFAYNAPDLFSKYQYNSDAEHRVAGKVIYEGENYKITFKKTGDKYVYDEKNDGYNALAFFPLDNKTNGAGQESMKNNRWNMDTGGCGNSQKNNCFFGMRFDAEFTIPEDYDKSKTNFTFEGDDDMWVFVDGERVLDLGGIHYPYPLANEKYRDTHNISLKDTYDYYKDDYVEGHKNTINFSDLGYNNGEKHQLTILYMERGGYDSHCHMEFVLPNLVPSDNVITKEDKYPITLTKNVSGIENLQNYSTSFSIYKAEDVENGAPKTGAVAVKTAKVDTFTKTKGSDVYTGNAAGQVKLPDGNYVIIEMPAAVDGYELTKVTGGSSEDDIKDTRAYSFTVNGENTYSVAFTNTYQRTTKTVSVTKSWSGRNQPNDVEAVIGLEQTVNGSTTTVQKNGTNWTQKAEYSADGTTVAFEGLPIKDSSGNVITYTAKELGIKVGGTTYTPDSNGVTIIKNGNTPTGYYTATTVTNTNGSVSITNTWTPVYRLTVKKTVTGSGAVVEESGYTFDLGITVEGSTVNEDLVKSLNGWDTYKTTVNVIPTGIAASEKGHTDVYLPAGYKYQVKEIKSNCEKYTTTITDGSGNEIAKEDNASEKYTIMANVATLNANATVSFTNTYNIPAPTGIHRDILPYVISMGIALAGQPCCFSKCSARDA